MLVVQELHIEGREVEDVRPEGDEPHVERDTQEDDGQGHSEETKLAHSQGTLAGVTPGSPAHLVKLKLIHFCVNFVTPDRQQSLKSNIRYLRSRQRMR